MNGRDSYSNLLAVSLQGGHDAIIRATATARSFGQAQSLSEDQQARLCIVVEELVANLYDHGGLNGTDAVEMILSNDPQGIHISLIDPGISFDPRSAPTEGEHPERGGGAGLDIVRAWAKIVGYEVTDQGNRLEFLLPLR